MTVQINGSTGIITPAIDLTTPLSEVDGGTGSTGAYKMGMATALASTSGTSIDFTGIPSWAKRITVMLDGVSTNGVSPPRLLLGNSGGLEVTGYTGYSVRAGSASNAYSSAFSTGFDLNDASAASISRVGQIILNLIDSATNTWVIAGIYTALGTVAYQTTIAGSKTLSSTLDRLRIITVNGTDLFDAGSINIMYEGV